MLADFLRYCKKKKKNNKNWLAFFCSLRLVPSQVKSSKTSFIMDIVLGIKQAEWTRSMLGNSSSLSFIIMLHRFKERYQIDHGPKPVLANTPASQQDTAKLTSGKAILSKWKNTSVCQGMLTSSEPCVQMTLKQSRWQDLFTLYVSKRKVKITTDKNISVT